MAESVIEELSAISECAVCLSSATKPKVLPCQHIFCLACLQAVYAQAIKRTPTKTGQLTCPVCNAVSPILAGDLTQLPSDFRTNRVAAALENLQKATSVSNCFSCSKNKLLTVAQALCFDCARVFCTNCHNKHIANKRFNNHVHTTLIEDGLDELFCSEHSEFFHMYCLECTRGICQVCMLTSHADHTVEAFARSDGRTDSIQFDYQQVKVNLIQVLSQNNATVTKHRDHVQTLKDDILERKMTLIKKLTEEEQQLSSKLDSRLNDFEKIIDRRTDDIQSQLSKLEVIQKKSQVIERPLARVSDIKLAVADFPSRDQMAEIITAVNGLKSPTSPTYKYTEGQAHIGTFKDVSTISESNNASNTAAVIRRLDECCEDETATRFIDSPEEQEFINKLDSQTVAQIYELENTYGVTIEIEKTDRLKRIQVSGAVRNAVRCQKEIRRVLENVMEEEEALTQLEDHMATRVQWEYRDNEGLHSYDKHINFLLETAYSNNKPSVSWEEDGDRFKVNFDKMTGIHINRPGEKLSLRRRDLKNEDSRQQVSHGPTGTQHWEPMQIHERYRMVALRPTDAEYRLVESNFRKTHSPNSIVKIERLQNPALYKQYEARRNIMDATNPKGHKNEMTLYRGTSETLLRSINIGGFNKDYSKHAKYLGNGIYFGREASYSALNKYSPPNASGHKHVYQCKVLTGEYIKGSSGLMEPPPKDPRDPSVLYDSVTDRSGSEANLFVIFHDTQAYPEYLITFI